MYLILPRPWKKVSLLPVTGGSLFGGTSYCVVDMSTCRNKNKGRSTPSLEASKKNQGNLMDFIHNQGVAEGASLETMIFTAYCRMSGYDNVTSHIWNIIT